MVAAVIELCMQTHHRIASQNTLADVFTQALFHGRNEVARHHAADHSILKLEVNAGVADGRKLDPYVAELAMAAGLLLMTSLDLDGLLMVSR